jgi:predicted nucleic acid-binding protein
MSTVAERLMEAARSLPEPLVSEVLDCAEFLRARQPRAQPSGGQAPLASLCGGLEPSQTFAGDPVEIQRSLRDEWTQVPAICLRRIKLLDALIAATALTHGLELLTLDEGLSTVMALAR